MKHKMTTDHKIKIQYFCHFVEKREYKLAICTCIRNPKEKKSLKNFIIQVNKSMR